MAGVLSGRICIVTGASRGIGKGIALQLGEAGATVYITGRNKETLQNAAREVSSRGGQCIPVVCDSSKEEEVKALFEQVQEEQNGRLDILVNNAYGGVETLFNNRNKKFWEIPASVWDDINNVGLRGHYICSVYAARMMVEANHGLIVVISSMGGLFYTFSVPYGVGKAACDRLAADCAVELRKHGVAYVSLWPGFVRTETIVEKVINGEAQNEEERRMQMSAAQGETPELSGKCIVALATDRNIMKLSGKVLFTYDLSRRYGFKDIDGRAVVNYRSLKFIFSHIPGMTWLSKIIPGFLSVPKWILTLVSSKF